MNTRMDYTSPLNDFKRPIAKIDFITLLLPVIKKGAVEVARFTDAIQGRVNVPKTWGNNRLTIHDPTQHDLQWLLDNYPETQILEIETAIDFALLDGSNDFTRLMELHKWLKVRLYPQRHGTMKQVSKRKYYKASTGAIVPDTMKTSRSTS